MSSNHANLYANALFGGQVPVAGLSRMMVFADGENLVFRYQDMVAKGRTPRSDIVHEPDVFVWHSTMTHQARRHYVLRATYYTYAVGDYPMLDTIRDRITGQKFSQSNFSPLPSALTACVFKKNHKSAKRKGVDIKICVDAMHHATHNNLDAVLLLSGDGDYLPLVEEVLRAGKQVFVGAFSEGLNAQLRRAANDFYCLDGTIFP